MPIHNEIADFCIISTRNDISKDSTTQKKKDRCILTITCSPKIE